MGVRERSVQPPPGSATLPGMGWFQGMSGLRRRRGASGPWLLAGVLLAGIQALAQEDPAGSAGAVTADVAPAPNIGLDRLLQLPDSYATGSQTTGQTGVTGATASQWRSRFSEADERIEDSKRQLLEAQRLLESNASSSSQWNLSAPGVQADASQDSSTGLPLRTRIRRLRQQLEQAEHDKRALEVEADLAGVPEGRRK